jgi:hypothetical protein
MPRYVWNFEDGSKIYAEQPRWPVYFGFSCIYIYSILDSIIFSLINFNLVSFVYDQHEWPSSMLARLTKLYTFYLTLAVNYFKLDRLNGKSDNIFFAVVFSGFTRNYYTGQML